MTHIISFNGFCAQLAQFSRCGGKTPSTGNNTVSILNFIMQEQLVLQHNFDLNTILLSRPMVPVLVYFACRILFD